MADISKIKLGNTTYDIKDEVARQTISGSITLKGTTTTVLTDGATTNPITINNESYSVRSSDAVFYGNKEFVFDGTTWHEFGDMSGLGDLAIKDTASAQYKPKGSNVGGGHTNPTSATVNSITNVGTLPTLTTTVTDEVLEISFSQGTLPTKSADQSVITNLGAFTEPTFSGTEETITVS